MSGNVNGGGGAQGGQGSGQGGQQGGAPGQQGQERGDLDLATVFDPPNRLSPDGEDLNLGGQDSGRGSEQTVGRNPGEGIQNRALVPYLDVLARYQELAARTIEQAGYPVRLRDLVRSYFDRISQTTE